MWTERGRKKGRRTMDARMKALDARCVPLIRALRATPHPATNRRSMSFEEIARRLEAEGHPSPGGKGWHRATVWRMAQRNNIS